MITTPQELEQTAMAVANWVVYNNRPFVLPADNNTKVYLTVLTEEQMNALNASPAYIENDNEIVVEPSEE